MLDKSLKDQLKTIFSSLESEYILHVISNEANKSNKEELLSMLVDITETSEKISIKETEGNFFGFNLLKNGSDIGIRFRGIPNGHEFTSLLMAILNADGKGKNIPDQFIISKIKSFKTPINISTYVSLTCTNCPDVVQTLNLIAILNENISNEMVDGAIYPEEIKEKNIQAVPTVYANGELLSVGKIDLAGLLSKLEDKFVTDKLGISEEIKNYDVLIAGGGPAGISSAIYSARKGLSVAVITDRIGGQVKETVGIENLISTNKTTGEELAKNLAQHAADYDIDIFEHRKIESCRIENELKIIQTASKEQFSSKALIIATGASWRKLNIPGESEYIGRGVAFCPHCDGPFYKNKHVAVIGGGNSGIEAAIDLSAICSKVTVVEFLEELKADKVLQNNAKNISNIEILTNSQSIEVIGDDKKVLALKIRNRISNEDEIISLDGIFVQIGLSPNSSTFKNILDINLMGEIVSDNSCRTSIPGIYAAGDVSTVPYKQIIISMGEGAKAALSAFDDRIRGKLDL